MHQPVRVLQGLHSLNRGGAQAMLVNYYRHIDKSQLQFDFLLSCANKCDYEDEILSNGGKIYRVPKLTVHAPWKYIRAVDSFFKVHPEYKVVHSHTSATGVFLLYIAKRNHLSTRIAHSHNIRGGIAYKHYLSSILKLFLRSVGTHFFACGSDAAEWLYGKRFSQTKEVTILRNAIETSLYAYNESKRLRIRTERNWADKFVVGHTGRFDYQKNHGFVLDIFKEIQKVHPESILLLIGDGENREDIEAQIKKERLEDAVVLEGVVENVFDYVQAMDVFLFPSRYEGLSVALIEAQAAGLRCFTSEGVVSKEHSITGLVEYIPLSKGSKYWAERVLQSKEGYGRRSMYDEVVDAGYDITQNAAWLENYYKESVYCK